MHPYPPTTTNHNTALPPFPVVLVCPPDSTVLAAEAADAARTLTGLNLLLAAAPRPDANVEHLCAAMNGERPDPRASSDSDAGTTPARKVRAEGLRRRSFSVVSRDNSFIQTASTPSPHQPTYNLKK